MTLPLRRPLVSIALTLVCTLAGSACTVARAAGEAPAAGPFDLDSVTRRAEQMAAEPYQDHRGKVPKWMLVGSTSYDQWRDIRYRPNESMWRDEGLPFQLQFFHPGLYFDRTVAVHSIDAAGVHPVPFSTDLFDYGKNDFASRIPKDIGYAGLRVHFPLKSREYFDELIVFLGASYFRSLGRDQVYGLSARGIAIDTVEPTGEEFPHFVEFWIEKPAPEATHLVVFALMEGPSITGAYRFDVTPGDQTTIDVESRLFLRKPVKKLGIAPLTSMFFFGENSRRRFDDFRPEVHDSDGLLLNLANGEWLWRPLENTPRVNASGFQMKSPRGFGLIQRDRLFANYQDIEARSELRPSAWVEPRGDWGAGRVELVEIPTDTELTDNIVAFWVPDQPAAPRQRMEFAYRLSFYGDDPVRPPAGRVVATRQDGGTPGTGHRFVIDFGGSSVESIPADKAPTAVVSAGPEGAVELLDHHLVKNPETGGWRLTFQLRSKKKDVSLELRAFLKNDTEVLTETWSNTIVR